MRSTCDFTTWLVLHRSQHGRKPSCDRGLNCILLVLSDTKILCLKIILSNIILSHESKYPSIVFLSIYVFVRLLLVCCVTMAFLEYREMTWQTTCTQVRSPLKPLTFYYIEIKLLDQGRTCLTKSLSLGTRNIRNVTMTLKTKWAPYMHICFRREPFSFSFRKPRKANLSYMR